MLKIYVVLGRIDWEGHDKPYGVFSSKAAAEALAEMVRHEGPEPPHEVFVDEYELDMRKDVQIGWRQGK